MTGAPLQSRASTSSASPVAGEAHATPLVFCGGAFVLPHPEKMAKGGEDWFFIATSRRALGIADGVGGWAEVGIDAGAYARMLMNNARDAADTGAGVTPQQRQQQQKAAAAASSSGASSSSSSGGPSSNGVGSHASPLPSSPLPDGVTHGARLSAQDILEAAYNKTQVMGSSTACVVVLNGSTLHASNLGDSGFMILRNGEMLMSTTQQQHSFNFPFQIGGADAMGDHPRVAQRYEVVVHPGDVVVAGTDGLWDNCFHEEIVSVIKYCREGNMRPDKAAQVLAHYARHRASDTKFASPFAYAAYQSGIKYLGGKMDDITVVVAFVEPAVTVASKL